jgi:hypothetical protein
VGHLDHDICEKDILNSRTFLGMVYLAVGIYLGLKYIFGIPPFLPETGYFIVWVFVVSTGTLLFLILGLFTIIFDTYYYDGNLCHYCKKPVYNYHKRIIVTWKEFTCFSGTNVELKAALHKSCHENADQKFVIPVPGLRDTKF